MDLLTEDEVIQGVENFLRQKGITAHKTLKNKASAKKKEHGPDLVFKLENEKGRGNWYIIEAKGNKKDGLPMKSAFDTNFRWAVSQIILRIQVDPRNYNYNYGIAVPLSCIDRCIKLIRNSWALAHLKIRLYGAFRDENGNLMAKEYLPHQIYTPKTKTVAHKTTASGDNHD